MSDSTEKSIFLAALELETAAERRRYLDGVCADDPQLRQAVEALLAAHTRDGNFLDSLPLPSEIVQLRPALAATTDRAGAVAAQHGATAVIEGPGATIGPYKLLEQIGEGGFGYVFVAEQREPVRRRVALKIIKPGMDSHEVVARFEAERQALAMMDHPNIARVFDAGTTAAGRPYFVMELVRGMAITAYCEQSGIALGERLELFIHVCQAVQHAHQKGIIHRDIKPANVLVTLHDGTPVAKVIDFGVAKALCEPLTAKTIYTRFAQVIGTPLYMSPEQVELSGLDVDTRSDIYALGVLLYEMLTGSTPFDEERFRTVAFDELRRIIREEEPPRPSERLTTVGQRRVTTPVRRLLAPHPATQSGVPAQRVVGDLDWIVMKALEKDRTRRYQTAAEFAADVRRFLRQEPVAARPPSPWYRFSKFARRNKAFLTTVSLVLATLVLGVAVSAWQAIRATKAREEADALRREAVARAENLKQANILLDNGRAQVDAQRWATAYQLLTKATELEPDHYPVWSSRAALFLRLGLWNRAAADFVKTVALGAPANNLNLWGVPQLFLYAGDSTSYRAASAEMLKLVHDSSDSFFQMYALRGCLVDPGPRSDSEELVRLAEAQLSAGFPGFHGPDFHNMPSMDHRDPRDRGAPPRPGPPPGREFGGPPNFWVPRELSLYVAGLAQYRAGHMDKAIAHLSESVKFNLFGPPSRSAYPVLAMAYQRAGRADDASKALEQAKTTRDLWIDGMQKASVGSMPMQWSDFIEHEVLYNEAVVVVTGAAAPSDPRLTALEQRSLEAVGVR